MNIIVKMKFAQAQKATGDKIFRVEKSNGSVMFSPVNSKGYQCRCPLDVEIYGPWFCIMGNLQGNKMLLYKGNNNIVRIRNCIHLLTAESDWIVEKQKDWQI